MFLLVESNKKQFKSVLFSVDYSIFEKVYFLNL